MWWHVEEAAAWTVVQAGGRGKSGDQVELGQEEVDEELLVEVHNYQEPVAQGVVRAADLLQVQHLQCLHLAVLKFCSAQSRCPFTSVNALSSATAVRNRQVNATKYHNEWYCSFELTCNIQPLNKMQLVVSIEELCYHVSAWLMQAAHNSPAQGHGSPRKQKQAGIISRLCGRSSQTEDAHVPGKKWVQVFDHAGAKWGHVLLSSWLDTSEERTVMHQSSPPPPMMQTLMTLPQQPYLPPPPSYLPPLQNTRDLGGGVVSQGKGYQQLTSWQVMAQPSPHTQYDTLGHD